MAVELKDLTKRSENYSQWYNELVVKPIWQTIGCTRLYGDQALRIRYLGEDATSVGRYVQGNGTRQRLFSLAYSEIIPQP